MLLLWGLLPTSECTTANGGWVATGGGGAATGGGGAATRGGGVATRGGGVATRGGGVATGGTLYMCHDEGCGCVEDSRDHP